MIKDNETANKNLSEGPIGKSLILFALPLLGSSLIQQLYSTFSLIFVGHILGKEASAAVGASSLLVSCVVGFFTGMSVGSGIVAAKFFGSGNETSLKKAIQTSMTVSLAGGAFLAVLGYLLTPFLLGLLNTPAGILDQAADYLRFYFLSLVSLVSYNMGAGILRALGNSKSPMVYQLIGGLSNIGTNALFIWFLDWGLKGAAIAILFSQTLAAVLVLRRLTKLDSAYSLTFRKILIDTTIFKKILYIGIPAGVQSMVITLSNLIVQYHINGLGVDSIAAFTAYFQVELSIYLPILAFGQAATTFTSMNIGAGKTDRVRQGVKTGLAISICTTIGLSLITLLLSAKAFALFSNDADVIAIGRRLAFIAFPFYFFYAILEVLGSTIRGAGKTLPPMVIVLLNLCLLRTALLYPVMEFFPSASSVIAVFPLSWAGAALCLWLYYRKVHWLPTP